MHFIFIKKVILQKIFILICTSGTLRKQVKTKYYWPLLFIEVFFVLTLVFACIVMCICICISISIFHSCPIFLCICICISMLVDSPGFCGLPSRGPAFSRSLLFPFIQPHLLHLKEKISPQISNQLLPIHLYLFSDHCV